jgi:hypothetical protein
MTPIETKIADYFLEIDIPIGIGTAEAACTIAGINLCLTGTLTDAIPDCMSDVIGRWVIVIQDAIPDAMRNSIKYRNLIPYLAGTGKLHEKERLDIITDWMWRALSLHQSEAAAAGYGDAWAAMCTDRTADAADHAARAANAAYAFSNIDYAARAVRAARATYTAANAAVAANNAAAAANAAVAANNAAAAAVATASPSTHRMAVWAAIDPIACLRDLIAVTNPQSNTN